MKKLNQKGIGHHLLLIALAVLVVGAAGFAGWRVYSAKKMDAQAAGWTVSTYGPGSIYSCQSRYNQDGLNGYLFKAKYYSKRSNNGYGKSYFSKPPSNGTVVPNTPVLVSVNFIPPAGTNNFKANTWTKEQVKFIRSQAYTSNWSGDAKLVNTCP